MDRQAVAAIATLDDGVRAALYDHVRTAGRPVTRAEAADAVGISRKLAAFHLDKLVEVGLLQTRLEAVGPRRVGRTPKVYEPAGTDVAVHAPPRAPGMLAEILLEAVVDQGESERASEAAHRVARARGVAAGQDEHDRVRPGRLGTERAMTLTAGLLAQYGFEPCRGPDGVRLRNCPFHPFARAEPELVCGINHAFVSGVLDGLNAGEAVDAVLAPRPDACCIELRAP